MLSGHGAQIDTIGILSIHPLSVALIVSEAILDTHDDPSFVVSQAFKVARAKEKLTISW